MCEIRGIFGDSSSVVAMFVEWSVGFGIVLDIFTKFVVHCVFTAAKLLNVMFNSL